MVVTVASRKKTNLKVLSHRQMASEYYAALATEFATHTDISVLPYLFGVHHWKCIERDIWGLFETSMGKDHFRCAVKNGVVVDSPVVSHKTLSKAVNFENVIRALKKMDAEAFLDGYCVLTFREQASSSQTMRFIPCFYCVQSQMQLKEWLNDRILHKCHCPVDFISTPSNLRSESANCEFDYFACKFCFYILHHISQMSISSSIDPDFVLLDFLNDAQLRII